MEPKVNIARQSLLCKKLYNVYGERYNTHITHVEHTKTPYNKMTTYPIEDMESRTTFVGVEFDNKGCGTPTFDQYVMK